MVMIIIIIMLTADCSTLCNKLLLICQVSTMLHAR